MKKIIICCSIITMLIVVGCSVAMGATNVVQKKKVTINPEYITKEYVGKLRLYYDDGPYVKGPTMDVDALCWVYTVSKTTIQGDVAIEDQYTYYLPVNDFSVMYRDNKFSGKGYHGGHTVILKEKNDLRFEHITESVFNGGTLVRNRSNDPIAEAFLDYIKKQ